MIHKLIPVSKELVAKLFTSFKRFPVTLFLTTGIVVIQIFLHHLGRSLIDQDLRDILDRVSMVLALGVPLSLSLQLFFQRKPAMPRLIKIGLYLTIAISLVLYYFFLLKELNLVSSTRYAAYTLAGYLLFASIPYCFKRENIELYWVQLLTNFATTYLYAVVLYLGLVAIIFTISKLFLFQFNRIYFDIWMIVAGIFAPAYFLADVPQIKQELELDNYSKVLKILLLYIVVPLLSAYSVILYAYFAKIIITRTWPEGIISHLVLWYSLISSMVIFFIYPFRNTINWVNRFISLFPKFILPLLAMMFVAMGIRIQSYGLTENRYFVLAAGIWVTAIFLYYLCSKKANQNILPLSLALVAVLTVTGPWSAYSISKLSQNNRFNAILTKYDMIEDNTLVPTNQEISREDQQTIISIFSYFKRFHSLTQLKYLPSDFNLSQTSDWFGFDIDPDNLDLPYHQTYFHYDYPDNKLINIKEFDYLVNISGNKTTEAIPGENLEAIYSLETNEFKIITNDQVIYQAKLSELITSRIQANPAAFEQELSLSDENDRVKIHYIFNSLSGDKDPITEAIEINYLNCFALIKMK